MSTSKINQAEWDALFASFGAALDAFEEKRNTQQEPTPLDGFSADDNLSEQAWEDYAEIARRDFERRIYEECDREDAKKADYEAAIRMSPHPECCACNDCALKHRFEEEA